MKLLEISVDCPMYQNKQTVYVYCLTEQHMFCNGCEQMCGDKRCVDCCKAVTDRVLGKSSSDLSLHKD